MSSVLVVVEQDGGRIGRMSWEAIAAGYLLGAQQNLPVDAAIIGSETAPAAEEIAARLDGQIERVEHPLLSLYTADGYTHAIQQLIEKEAPAYVLFPHTYQVRDYAPALAARLNQVLISDVIAIGEGPVFQRQLLQGRLVGSYQHSGGGPCLISVQAGAFPALEPGSETKTRTAAIAVFQPALEPSMIRTRPGAPFRASAQTVDLASAQRIVSVGRGIQGEENIQLVKELAAVLDAELAASRPICDNGWLPMERQVGSSGQTVAPRLYLAVGISGAIQHLVGMKGSHCIVAINKDPEAPIFEVADYGIIGDLFEVVPALIEAAKAGR